MNDGAAIIILSLQCPASLALCLVVTIALTRSPISIIEVFFSAIIIVNVTAIESRICAKGYLSPATVTKPTNRPAAEPARMPIMQIAIYRITTRSDQINETNAELANAIKVEKAAPRVP